MGRANEIKTSSIGPAAEHLLVQNSEMRSDFKVKAEFHPFAIFIKV